MVLAVALVLEMRVAMAV
jgi:hypothetical protein